MALDEALLDGASPDSLILRFYQWAGPATTFGYSLSFAFARKAAEEKGLAGAPIVRRATGGGVVFHDGDLTFSLIFPWPRLHAPSLVYKDLHRGIHLGLKAFGVRSRLWSPPNVPAGPPLEKQCFSRAEPMDLVDEQGRKLLGGALRRRRGMGLYQGSLRPETLACPAEDLRRGISQGLEMEWGRPPRTGLDESWLDEARRLEPKYRSDEWNRRR
ncbi:MAG: lipoate--protein ligase family protein [Elusimicrobia bacterium]|nr:lipoate--protein ligase family protein [Elusimicrobiota bacterium]